MRAALLVPALLLVLAGCSDDADPADPAPSGPVDGVSLSFTQLRIDEGSTKAQLRVVNTSAEDLHVTGVGLDWPGFGDFVVDYDTDIVAGRTLDLRFDLPAPDCAPTTEPVIGRLRFSTSTRAEQVLDAPLDESGTGFVTRIHDRFCEDLRVTDGVTIAYGDTWRVEGTGRRARLVGELTLTRGSEAGRIELSQLRGSVLLELSLPEAPVLEPGQDTITVPLVMVVPRCDEHALAESSHTFHFLAEVRFDDGTPIPALRIPPEGTKAAGQRLLEVACEG